MTHPPSKTPEPSTVSIADLRPFVLNLPFIKRLQDADREEVVQQTYLRLRREWTESTTAPISKGLVRLTALHVLWDRLRQQHPAVVRNPDVAVDPSPLTAEATAERNELRTHLMRALVDNLTDRERHIIHFGFFQNLTHADIAQRLHISVDTVARSLRDSLTKLHTSLANFRDLIDGGN